MTPAPQIPPISTSPPISQTTHSIFAVIMASDFEKQSYWHKRFSTEKAFEWLLPSADFMPLVKPVLDQLDPDTARILHIGFGTSDLQNHFRSRGFRDVLNVDYEPLAIDRGRDLEEQAFGDVQMRYDVQDATQLDLSEEFNLIVDKSTVDAISCGGEMALRRMAAGIKGCLADGGVWISFSYSAYRFDLDDLPFDVEVLAKVLTRKTHPNDPDIYHWCYLLRPKHETPLDSPIDKNDNPAGQG
ncbi:Methyltransferase-like protein 13 [Fusarium austroafricanum]|uniref:Methyltransferase-like protein 13 n=1 Tax=Fusarium austroafricanum TaxID=2364996 RepID=A0A8H4NXD5_9HYPO|nr:Methyltransferase-like protein 13 [Fusarium austroafricanum]